MAFKLYKITAAPNGSEHIARRSPGADQTARSHIPSKAPGMGWGADLQLSLQKVTGAQGRAFPPARDGNLGQQHQGGGTRVARWMHGVGETRLFWK